MDELWKEIEDYPLYEVSNHGRIRNTKSGRILHTYPDPKGYLVVTLSNRGIQKTVAVHKLVANAFVEKYYDDLDVAFLDGDKSNPRADNLDWWKKRDIQRRSRRKYGRHNNSPTKTIRLIETGEVFTSIMEASAMLGISVDAISRSLNRRSLGTREGYHFVEIDCD